MGTILLSMVYYPDPNYVASLREKTDEMLKAEWDTLKEWIRADVHEHGIGGGKHTPEYRNLARTVLAEFQRRGVVWPE